MSTLRRLTFACAFAVPLSLAIAVPASAHVPDETWSAESSASYAGIGGAGTTETEEGTDCWGHEWSEEETVVAGIGGAAVIHSEDGDDDDGAWTGDVDDDYDAPAVVHHTHPAVHHTHPAAHHPDPQPQEPAEHEAGYTAEKLTADIDGATSTHVASHAGEHHAVYEAEHLTAGPEGASSAGVHSLAVPDFASYHAWYTAAGEDGAATHSVSAVADADDGFGYYRS
jgi:hypothetical protein